MEIMTRKRKAQEMAESSGFVVDRISELNAVLVERDVALVDEIKEQQDEIWRLKKQLVDAHEDCARWKETAEFRHPDAVIDRIRVKLWHHGDLSILRKAIDPQTRVLRNTEGRGDRALYVCDSAPKKAGVKATANDCQALEMSPKHECEEKEPVPLPTEPAPASPTDFLEEMKEQEPEEEHEEEHDEENEEENEEEEHEKEMEEEEEGFVNVPVPAPIEAQKETVNDSMTSPLAFNGPNGTLMLTSSAR